MLRTARVAVLLTFAVLAATLVPTVAPGGTRACADETLAPTRANAPRIRAATLCLMNAERRRHKLPALRSQPQLRTAAQRYSTQMVRRRFFDHVAPDGSTLSHRVRRTAYLRRASTWRLGENLAYGSGKHATPRTTMGKWMASPGHRQQVLQRHYRDIGIGVTSGTPSPRGGPGGTYSAVFGARVRRR
jgi:uncharacterized protein YkwD